jgi:hypothetical protein
LLFATVPGWDAILVCREEGRPIDFLKLGLVFGRARFAADAKEVRAGTVEVVEGVVEAADGVARARDVRDGFFCSEEKGRVCLGFESDWREGFLARGSVDDGARSCEWLLGALRGSLEVGLGIPELRTGRDDGGSMIEV